ncbi:MAG: hypothetical protein VB080_15030 [Propionicimonas sp.]|uniref:hypothetical protein n=1 Tax=Propionicimonas sp. TaxID=1955623 RepID=UPI002B1F2897|nr:hypothetical protein [Propionicimonas sp.]MEA4945734.1 hypothetical protein [Propionicimonas sp.]MEA5052785.1 hypothetical protein [Propionicimonas sp.]
MQQFSPSAVSPTPSRWRPPWAQSVAIILLVVCVGTLGFGLLLVISDLSRHDDFLDGVGALIGGMIGLPGLLAGIPLVVFLARRGGRVPFVLGVAVAVLGFAALVWFFGFAN